MMLTGRAGLPWGLTDMNTPDGDFLAAQLLFESNPVGTISGSGEEIGRLLFHANRGAEEAQMDSALDSAAESAPRELDGKSAAWVAHGLVREAISILVNEPDPKRDDPRLGDVVTQLGAALESLGYIVDSNRKEFDNAEAP